MSSPIRSCPDCRSSMEPIKLLDWVRTAQIELSYAAGDAEPSWFFNHYAVEGKVGAQMCPVCGRIVLHGEPAKRDVAKPPPREPTGTCVLHAEHKHELDMATSALADAGIPCAVDSQTVGDSPRGAVFRWVVRVPDDAASAARELLLGLPIGGVVEADG